MADLTLSVLTALPERFLSVSARELAGVLTGPTLIHLPGRRSPAVLVCILLHGNETVGLHAIQAVLHKYAGSELPRALSVFVGNVPAAHAGVRRLDDQPDYNRVWPGGTLAGTPEAGVALAVLAQMRTRGVFASQDLHNNTGLNPLYACVSSRDPRNLHLAALFSRTVIYFEQPTGTQVAAFEGLCPAVAVECGKPGNPEGEARAAALVEAVLHLAEFPAAPVHAHDIDLFHTIGTVRVRPEVAFAFSPANAALVFDHQIDHYNFRDLPSGTRFGHVSGGEATLPLEVIDATGRIVSDRYFVLRDGVLSTAQPLMPAMLTTDPSAIRQDCLCYLMERTPLG